MYLGFPMLQEPPKLAHFQFILDNMNNILARWKTKFLNIVGRTTLAKTCLSSIPNNIMQFFCLPSKIHNLINRSQRNFIWGTTTIKRKMPMVIGILLPFLSIGSWGCSLPALKMIPYYATFLRDSILTPPTYGPKSLPRSINSRSIQLPLPPLLFWKNIQRGWHLSKDAILWSVYDGTKIDI